MLILDKSKTKTILISLFMCMDVTLVSMINLGNIITMVTHQVNTRSVDVSVDLRTLSNINNTY